jgi:ribonuclease R
MMGSMIKKTAKIQKKKAESKTPIKKTGIKKPAVKARVTRVAKTSPSKKLPVKRPAKTKTVKKALPAVKPAAKVKRVKAVATKPPPAHAYQIKNPIKVPALMVPPAKAPAHKPPSPPTKAPHKPLPKAVQQPQAGKEKRLYDNLSKVIQQFIMGRRYTPMGPVELFKRLKLPPNVHALCKEIVEDLIEDGIIEMSNKMLGPVKIKIGVITGLIRVHARGFGFVIPDHPTDCPQDVFIPKHLTDNAVDGDHVEIELAPEANWEKGPEGKVLTVLKRGRTHLAGIIRSIDVSGNPIAYVPLLGAGKPAVVQQSQDDGLKLGDRIIMKVVEWSDKEEPTICEFSHLIGHISNPACDVPAAIEEFGLIKDFSAKALKQAKGYGKTVTKKDLEGREDFTKIETITIDPETAKDFDDALSLHKDRKGNYELVVHIADVAHYIPEGSPLDLDALGRCNSTYFPGTCVPMLPEELSNQLCSLRPDVIRLTVSVIINFDKEGNVLKSRVTRGFIKSARRFTYEEAKSVIDGKLKSPFAPLLKRMVDLCLLLKKKRSERGSIDFALPDIVLVVDEKGMPSGVRTVEYDISHQLVEEFMLKANETVAKHLFDKGKPVIYRIHEEPSLEDFQDFFALARALGFPLPEKPTTQDLQQLFDKAKKTPFGQQLSVGFIRSMKLAIYSPENVGHYGLSLEYYCHFTSPIRRYTDLIIGRLLFDEEGKDLDLHKIALKCSDQERLSFRAESSVKVLKKLRLLKTYLDEDPLREYNAVITRVKPFGISFEIADLMVEGFLHISQLENDYFIFDPKRNVLFGRSSGKVHSCGETIKVMPVSVDLILSETRWVLASKDARSPHHKREAENHPRNPRHPGRSRRRR